MVVLGLFAAACSGVTRTAETGGLRGASAPADADPTVHPARLFPENVDDRTSYGSEPGGGSRVIVAGLRVVTSPGGALLAADDRLPSPPSATVALPERLGGGFLYLLGTTLWRADRWLAPARPIFTSPQPVQAILPGLDRVYVRGPTMILAIDGRTGQPLDLGAWPASPYVASYAAADGWRAAAVTDLRGVVATLDAGATWRRLELPIDAKQVVVSSDSLDVGGFDAERQEAWYELRADGSLTRLGSPPREAKDKLLQVAASSRHGPARPPPAPVASPHAAEEKDELATRPFGTRPLAAAIEDGWPLRDGTALVAREGSLGRVRLSDGALVDVAHDAFPLKTARCHPVSLARRGDAGAFGFVCGEPRGATAIYAYDPARGQLAQLRRFDRPRVVTSSGTGALAVRGPCAPDGEAAPPPRPAPARLERADERAKGASADHEPREPKEPRLVPVEPPRPAAPEVHPYCVHDHGGAWREVHVRGDIGGERVVVLADDRIAVITPPQGLGTVARLTILDRPGDSRSKPRAVTVPVTFPTVPGDVARVLRLGLWLDGFEERRPGVLGGWIEASGVMLGVEIALDGAVTVGQFIRDAGMPFVSGRYGLGWTASRRGFETTDGGMTWTSIDLPDPLVPAAKVTRRACGPVGCLGYGWLRVGWGQSKGAPVPTAPPPYRAHVPYSPARLELSCEPAAAPPPTPPPPTRWPMTYGRFQLGNVPGPSVSPALGSFNGLSELPPFFSQAAPVLRDPERGINVDVRDLLERGPNLGSLARIYAWGPRAGDWETLGRWQVKWLSPLHGWQELRAALPSRPPQQILDVVRSAGATTYGNYGLTSSHFQFVAGDDASHALLVGRRQARSEIVPYELEADRAPVEVRRADGEPFGEIEAAVRAAGRWFLATTESAGGSRATTIWQIEGGVARELARVPRTTNEAQPSARARLARRSDGRAVALVVDGQQSAGQPTHVRWALSIDLETGALGDPEPLGYTDLSDRTLEACSDDLVGWVIDTALPVSSVRVHLPRGSGALTSTHARLRLTGTRACVERLSGAYDGQASEGALHLAGAGGRATAPPRAGEVFVSAMSRQRRLPLRCTTAPRAAGSTASRPHP
jgi:hypothetical protein